MRSFRSRIPVAPAPGGPSTRWGLSTLAALLVAFLVAIPGFAQEPTATAPLTGTVRSAPDGGGISGAAVRIPGLGLQAFADATGRFRFPSLPPGTHRVEVERIGYRPTSVEVTLDADPARNVPVEIRLDPDPLLLSELVVSTSGELRRRAETPVSVGSLHGEAIREVNPTHPAEIMNRFPGVWVSPTSTEGHMTAIRQPITTNPVYLFLEDGVPTRSPGFFNHNALYEINVPQSDRIEVIRGPGTSLYGSDAIGGVIDVETRPASTEPQVDATLEGNSLGFGRALVSAAGSRGENGLRLDLNLTEGDRWRDDTEYRRRSATLRWDRNLGSGLQLRTTATWSAIHQDEPSVVSREDLDRDPAVNYHPIAYRSVEAVRLASRLQRRTEGSVLEVTPFIRWNSLDIMPPWMLNFDPVVYESGHSSTGLMVRYHRELSGLRSRITTGVDLDRSPGHRVEDRIQVSRQDGVATGWELRDRIYDYEAVFLGLSPYVQVALQPLDRVHVTAGLRYDDVGFEYTSNLAPLQEGPHRRPADTRVRYSNPGPSLGATVDVAPELNVFTSFRESFRAPSEGQLFRQGAAESTVTLNPVLARSVEAGVRGDLRERLSYEAALYRMEVRDDILGYVRPEDGLRESLNAGRTRHQGVEVGLTARLPGDVVADLSLTRASHRYVEWSPRAGESFAGNRIQQAPRDLASARLRSPLPLPAGGSVELEWVSMGEFWMDPENENAYEGHDLWNLRFEVPLREGISVFGRVMNLTDRVYAERAGFHPFRGGEFSPGKPRAAFVGVRYGWGR